MNITGTTICVLLLLAFGTGCGEKTRISDEAERDHPAMKKARDQETNGDLAGARLTYESILDANPTLARAHLGLAFLLDQKADFPEALFHFKRYLALRPNTEKRGMIEAHIREAQLAYVGTVFTNQAAILKRMGAVETENSALKIKVSNLEAQANHLRTALNSLRAKYAAEGDHASRELDKSSIPVPALRPAGKLVRIEKGDNLRKIAARIYGSQARWRDIFEANRKVLKTPEDVKVGQSLWVPDGNSE